MSMSIEASTPQIMYFLIELVEKFHRVPKLKMLQRPLWIEGTPQPAIWGRSAGVPEDNPSLTLKEGEIFENNVWFILWSFCQLISQSFWNIQMWLFHFNNSFDLWNCIYFLLSISFIFVSALNFNGLIAHFQWFDCKNISTNSFSWRQGPDISSTGYPDFTGTLTLMNSWESTPVLNNEEIGDWIMKSLTVFFFLIELILSLWSVSWLNWFCHFEA